MKPTRLKVKVLTNDLQSHLSGWLFEREVKSSGLEGQLDSDKLLDHIIGWDRPRIEPVFNRVGFYLRDGSAWYEFQLLSGRFVGIEYDVAWFKYKLEKLNSEENPVGSEDWEMIKQLLKRGVIKDSDGRWSHERYRRDRRVQDIEMRRDMLCLRERIKVEEKKKELL